MIKDYEFYGERLRNIKWTNRELINMRLCVADRYRELRAVKKLKPLIRLGFAPNKYTRTHWIETEPRKYLVCHVRGWR